MLILAILLIYLVAPPALEWLLIGNRHLIGLSAATTTYLFYLIASLIMASPFLLAARTAGRAKSATTEPYIDYLIYWELWIGLPLFTYFVASRLGGFNFAHLIAFSERYRNSYYTGTGFYTSLLTFALPLTLSIKSQRNQKISAATIIGVLSLIAVSIVLGLRIFLFPVFYGFIYQVSTYRRLKLKYFIYLTAIFLFLAFNKYYLSLQLKSSQSLLSLILNPLTRLHIPYLLKFYRTANSDTLVCLAPFSRLLENCAPNTLKFAALHHAPYLNYGFPYLSKYSGLAEPLPVFIFNSFGVVGAPIFASFLLIFFLLVNQARQFHRKPMFATLAYLVSIQLFLAMVEDFTAIQELDLTIAFYVIFFIGSQFYGKIHPTVGKKIIRKLPCEPAAIRLEP